MSGGGRPGTTIKTKVLAKTADTLTISLEGDEAEYFEVDHHYVAQFVVATHGGGNGGHEDEGHS